MAGLGPAIHAGAVRRLEPSQVQLIEQVPPLAVLHENQPDLPRSRWIASAYRAPRDDGQRPRLGVDTRPSVRKACRKPLKTWNPRPSPRAAPKSPRLRQSGARAAPRICAPRAPAGFRQARRPAWLARRSRRKLLEMLNPGPERGLKQGRPAIGSSPFDPGRGAWRERLSGVPCRRKLLPCAVALSVEDAIVRAAPGAQARWFRGGRT